MSRRLPPLNGLRAFEAAGRLGSFTAAADELSVTQTAVSHMVRLLEKSLGYNVFLRKANRLELTTKGRSLLKGLTDAFDEISRLTERVAAMGAGPVLTVGVGPTLAVNWFIPRLSEFYEKCPDIEIRVATGGATRPVRDDWTCTIRRDVSAWPGYIAENLFPSTVIPVCTAAIAAGLHSPSDLQKAKLIRVAHMEDAWPLWFNAADLSPTAASEMIFDNNALAMQAAFDGMGVALAELPYVLDALANRRLAAPFPIVAQKKESWCLQYRPDRADEFSLKQFRDWLHRAAKNEREAESEFLKRLLAGAPMRPAHLESKMIKC